MKTEWISRVPCYRNVSDSSFVGKRSYIIFDTLINQQVFFHVNGINDCAAKGSHYIWITQKLPLLVASPWSYTIQFFNLSTYCIRPTPNLEVHILKKKWDNKLWSFNEALLGDKYKQVHAVSKDSFKTHSGLCKLSYQWRLSIVKFHLSCLYTVNYYKTWDALSQCHFFQYPL